MVIPGPQEPKNFRAYLQPVAASFQKLAEGVEVMMHLWDKDLHLVPDRFKHGAFHHPRLPGLWRVPMVHRGYLYDVAADTPARVKIFNWAWHTRQVRVP